MRPWTAAMMVPTVYTHSQAVQMATENDIVVANGHQIDNVAAMRQANPDLELYHYQNAIFAQENEANTYPASWYAYDAQGRKIRSTGYGNYLMDLNSSGWRNHVVQRCGQLLISTGYDGCYLDMLGVAPLFDGYLTSPAVNSANGQPWTAEEWIAGTSRIARAVKNGNAPHPVIGNGLGNGRRYFQDTNVLVDGIDGVIAESFLRSGGHPIDRYKTESQWIEEVEMIRDAEARGSSVLAMTKINDPASNWQQTIWREYAMASFWMATGGQSSFTFHASTDTEDVISSHPWETIDLGVPTGPHATYAKVQGVYQRTFTGGRVLVNPTENAQTVSLGATYIDVRTGEQVTSVTVAANRGMMLQLADGGQTDPPPPPPPGPGTTVNFSDHVSVSGDTRDDFDFQADAGQTITIQLTYANAGADLNLFLKNPGGNMVAMDTSSDNPTTLVYDGNWAGTWNVAVKAVKGGSNFDLSVTTSSAGSVPDSISETFTGSVNSNGTARQIHEIELTAGMEITAVLEWPGANDRLSLFLRDPDGNFDVMDTNGPSPRQVTHLIDTTGVWRLEVKSVQGYADYTLSVTS